MIQHSISIDALIEGIIKAQASHPDVQTLYRDSTLPYKKNNCLFFIKPEITRADPRIQLQTILELIMDKINSFGLQIHGIRILPAAYLKKHNLIRSHYGVISRVAAEGRKALSDEAYENFQAIYQTDPDEAIVLGGLEFLETYPFFNVHSLDCMWQNGQVNKLAGGCYVQKWRINRDTVFVLNAFHPTQLEHFTLPGRSIVVMNLSGDSDWTDLRNRFVGTTNPLKALPGSLRNELYLQAASLGLDEISQSYNGVHLSAGPVEALLELQRFESDLDKQDPLLPLETFPYGQSLKAVFDPLPTELLHNQTMLYRGKQSSVFDLTEEMNSAEALLFLKSLFK